MEGDRADAVDVAGERGEEERMIIADAPELRGF